MKLIVRSTLTAVLILTTLFACAKKDTGGGELRSTGDIIVNGTGFDGTVHAGTKVLYTLKDIHAKQNYTLRTEIGLLSDGKTPDGALTVDIYSSEDAFRNNPAVPLTSAVAQRAPNDNVYEVPFFEDSLSGDFVVVISGTSLSTPNIQFFYDLRLMSADQITGALTPVVTSETITTYEVVQINPLNPRFLNIYSGGDVASSGVYTISLISNATTTIANPQIFVYRDSSLTIDSLMLSSIPTLTNFVRTNINAGVPDINNAEQLNADVITGVTFTSGTGGGPFIVLKGFISAVTYTLSVGP